MSWKAETHGAVICAARRPRQHSCEYWLGDVLYCSRPFWYSSELNAPSPSPSISPNREDSIDCSRASSRLIEPSPFLSSVENSGHSAFDWSPACVWPACVWSVAEGVVVEGICSVVDGVCSVAGACSVAEGCCCDGGFGSCASAAPDANIAANTANLIAFITYS